MTGEYIPGEEVDVSAVCDCSRTATERAVVFVVASFPARQRVRQRYTIHCHPAPVATTAVNDRTVP